MCVCANAAQLSASEIDLCFHVCCYGEISLLLCILFQGCKFWAKESCAEHLNFFFLLPFAPRSRSEVLQADSLLCFAGVSLKY